MNPTLPLTSPSRERGERKPFRQDRTEGGEEVGEAGPCRKEKQQLRANQMNCEEGGRVRNACLYIVPDGEDTDVEM